MPTRNRHRRAMGGGSASVLVPDVLALTFVYGSTGAVPSSGTYTAQTVAIDQNDIIRVCTVGGSPGTWQRAMANPYDFYVDDYGALGNATKLIVTTVAGSHTVTATTGTFTSTAVDAGKNTIICGAGGAVPGGPDVNTIATITDSTHAVLTNAIAAGGSGSGLAMVYASDDRVAIDNCITAAQAYAMAHGYFVRVLFSDKGYGLGANLFQSVAGVSGATLSYNTQIRVPVGTDLTGETGKFEVQFLGPTAGGQCRFWTALGEDAPGTVLFSFSVGPNTADGTFGQQAIMQVPIGGAGISNDAGFFNMKLVARGLTFVQPGWSNSVGLDEYTSAERDISITSSVFAPSTNEGGGVNPYIAWFSTSFWINNKIGAGIRMSKAQQNDQCEYDVCVQGLNIGAICEADHIIIKRLSIAAVDSVMLLNLGGNTQHNLVANVSAENYNNGVKVTGGSPTPSMVQCSIVWDSEMTSSTIAGDDVVDSNNQLYGTFHWSDFTRSGLVPTISGGSNLKIINDMQGAGHMASPPSVPATTVAAAPVYRDATVIITSGGAAVSAITVDGTATGLTLGASGSVTVRVPAGKQIKLTYASTAPTWAWWLD